MPSTAAAIPIGILKVLSLMLSFRTALLFRKFLSTSLFRISASTATGTLTRPTAPAFAAPAWCRIDIRRAHPASLGRDLGLIECERCR